MMIGDPETFPSPTDNQLKLLPGFGYKFELTALRRKNLPLPYKSQCTSQFPEKCPHHGKYTPKTCPNACFALAYREACNCSSREFDMTSLEDDYKNLRFCSKGHRSNCDQAKFSIENITETLKNDCRPRCEDVEFKVISFSSRILNKKLELNVQMQGQARELILSKYNLYF